TLHCQLHWFRLRGLGCTITKNLPYFPDRGSLYLVARFGVPLTRRMASVLMGTSPRLFRVMCCRRKVEDQCCIDASALYKAGKLVPGACCVWSWSRDTDLVGAVNVVSNANSIEICGCVTTDAGVEAVQEVLHIGCVLDGRSHTKCSALHGDRAGLQHRRGC